MEQIEIDFYDRIILEKKKLKLNNNLLGSLVGMTGDAFRMALTRKSLSVLQKRELEKYFGNEKKDDSGLIRSTENQLAETIKVSDPFEQYAVESKNGHLSYNMPDGSYMMKVPLVPVKAYGRYVSEGDSAEFLESAEFVYFKVDHVGKGKYRAFEIKGDSMDNGLRDDTPDKALVLARELGRHKWPEGFRDNVYGWVIVTKNNIVFKDIIDQDLTTGVILCHSRNPSPEYGDFPLSLDEDVQSIWKVIKRQF